jgi:hypothetical protein
MLTMGLPLMLWRSRRLEYGAVFSLLAVVLVAFVGTHGLHGNDGLVVRYTMNGSPHDVEYELRLASGSGGLGAALLCTEGTSDPGFQPNSNRRIWVSFGHGARDQYPGWKDPIAKFAGFEFNVKRGLVLSPSILLRFLGVFVLPVWFCIVLLLIWPALFLVRLRGRRRVRGWLAAGCCASCGYDLRGNPAGDKCPECGSAIGTT